MSSRLIVNSIRHTGASGDAVTLANDGTCTAKITNNLSNRNVIINGAMQVAQRGDTALGGDGYGGCDRFYWNESGGAAVTLKQGGASDSPVSEGFSNCQHVDITTADTDMGTHNYNMLSTRLEGRDLQGFKKGTSNAEQFTLSFWIRSTVTGTYIAELVDQSNSSRHVNKAYTISASNTWEKKEITFPADTTGTITSDESRRLDVNWWFGAGTNYTSGTLQTSWGADTNANKAVGQVNAVNSTSNDIMLTGVQLEVGSVATDFEHRSYGQELALCHRYYYRLAEGQWKVISENCSQYNSNWVYFSVPLPVEMRSTPSLDAASSSNYYIKYANDGDTNFSTIGLDGVTTPRVLGLNANVSGTAGHSCMIRTANSNTYVAASSEL